MVTHVFRASELPLIATNPAAWSMKREAGVSSDNEPAALGRAFARGMEHACIHGRVKVDLAKIAREFSVPLADLRELWDMIDYDPAGWSPEMPFSLRLPLGDDVISITCHVDRVRLVGTDTVEVEDDKTERDVEKAASAEDHMQLLAYCVATTEFFARPHAIGRLNYVRRGERGWSTVDLNGVDEIAAVKERIRAVCERAIRESLRPAKERDCRVGDKCRYCGGRSICPIAGQDLKLGIAALNDGALVIDEKTFAKVDGLVKLAASFVEQGKAALRSFLESHGKPIPDGLGREYRLIEKSRAKSIDANMVRVAALDIGVDKDLVPKLVAEVEARRGKSYYDEMRLVSRAEEATPSTSP